MKSASRLFLLFIIFSAGAAFVPGKKTFEEAQKDFPRVKQAYERNDEYINRLCRSKGISPETFGNMFIRAFKQEKKLQVWVQRTDGRYVLLQTFDIYGASGVLGPKRREGDRQVPEGFYFINDFNPNSNYHLSLGINYPNESDRTMSTAPRKGGDIYIHGGDASVGCLAMSDDFIEIIYIFAVKARNQGQQKIPVHIYPFIPTMSNIDKNCTQEENKPHRKLWLNLAQGYYLFRKYNRLPEVSVNEDGYYQFHYPDLAESK